MKAKWTPGPLTVRDESRMEEERVIYKPGPSFSIYSNGHDGKGNGRVLWATATEITSKADATLYALAPEMAEALRRLIGSASDVFEAAKNETNLDGSPMVCEGNMIALDNARALLSRLEVEK